MRVNFIKNEPITFYPHYDTNDEFISIGQRCICANIDQIQLKHGNNSLVRASHSLAHSLRVKLVVMDSIQLETIS